MSKFGELVSGKKVLIAFVEQGKVYDTFCEKEVAKELFEKVTVIKVIKEKNEELMKLLGIHFYPSANYYENGNLVQSFRFSECMNKNIVSKLE